MASKFRVIALASGLAVAFGSSLTPSVVLAEGTVKTLGERVAEQSQQSRQSRTAQSAGGGWDPSTGVSKEAWASALKDSSVKYAGDGPVYVVEPRMSDAEALAGTNRVAPVHTDISLTNAFSLHSRPGSSKVIYLDFDGHLVENTAWSATSVQVGKYDIDGQPANFSSTELQNIVDTWSAVAEDFAIFDVDVTTEDPGQAAIDRTSYLDMDFGVRALITDESSEIVPIVCPPPIGCQGVAYVGSFDYVDPDGDWQWLSPAFAFTRNYFSGKTISDVVSHEVGHNLGLSHDGGVNPPSTTPDGYYLGRNGWAPIMGAGYNQPLAQWSNGTYTSATNPEDDIAVMQAIGLQLLADDHGGSVGASTFIDLNSPIDGVIRSRSDVDFFRFVPLSSNVDVSVELPSISPNLDVSLTVLDSNGSTTLATANPNFSSITYQAATGLAASLTVENLIPGQTYYVKIDGVGFGTGASTGYSDYGSLGDYRMTVLGSGTLGEITPAPTPSISGKAKVGRRLTLSIGMWPAGVSTKQQWLRNGSKIRRAKSATYRLTTADIRKRITVRVTATKLGYSPATMTSEPTSKIRR